MKRRVFGLETEYGIASVGPGRRRSDPASLAYNLVGAIRRISDGGSWRWETVFSWLGNGARVYVDGAHPEYATPECDSVRQAIAADRAGQVLLTQGLVAINRSATLRHHGETVVVRNNSAAPQVEGDARMTFGCHENYLVERPAHDSCLQARLADELMAFLVTRQLLCGAGDLVPNHAGVTKFEVSQRAQFVEEAVANSTTSRRPIFNTRDESHAALDQYRLHVIVGDSNMSEWSGFLKLGSTHLVLRMIEAGESFSDLRLADPVHAIQVTSRSLTGRRRLALASDLSHGLRMTSLDIQRAYLERAEDRFAGEAGETAQILAMWRFVVDAYSTPGRYHRPPSTALIAERLGRTVDWAIKYRLIEAYRARHGYSLDDVHVHALNLQYHRLQASGGLYESLEEQETVERITTNSEVATLVRDAPTTTRATLRGRAVRAAYLRHSPLSVDWEWIKIGRSYSEKRYLLRNPLRCHNAKLERRLESFERPLAPGVEI